jgi:hypothetical protein
MIVGFDRMAGGKDHKGFSEGRKIVPEKRLGLIGQGLLRSRTCQEL